MNEDQVKLGALAGLVHNFGLARIGSDIVSKAEALTSEDHQALERHPVEGASLPQIAEHEELAEIVAQSRERGDGSGYPRGLESSEMHPLSTYLHAVDIFEALTQSRAYRESQHEYNAMKIVHMEERGRIGEEAIRALMDFYSVYPITIPLELNTRQQGKVIDTNESHPLSPVVAIMTDSEHRMYDEPRAIDLSQNEYFLIRRVIEPSSEFRERAAKIC
jgi:HD-GYP domain-containing protein (c-di-GMP phosphodiesterase class II)